MLLSYFSKKRKVYFIASALVISLALASFSFSLFSKSSKKDHHKIAPISLVSKENLAYDITLNAELYPIQEADLYSKVAGYLKTINVDEGTAVKKGQLIATLDVDELKRDLEKAKASYDDAKLDYDRITQVIEKNPGLLAESEVDKSRSISQMAKANYEKSRTLFEYSKIKAPFDGIITKRFLDPGALVQSAINSNTQTSPIVHIADNTKLRIIFPIPESVVSKVKVGTPVEILVQSNGKIIQSKISTISGKINQNVRSMDTEIYINNKEYKITPGMYASVKVNLDEKKAVLTLPIQAVALNGGKPNVWLINANNEIEEREIKIGMQTAERLEITEGLNDGDKILFGSRNSFSVGMVVEPKIISAKKEES